MIRILVVEDDLEINRLVSEHLSREGYHTESAVTGEEALSRLATKEYHLVILDIMMPAPDGYTVLNRIRSSGDVPVLILSAKCSETDKIIGLGLGADDYVTKPFSPGELSARVRALLRRYLKYTGEEGSKNRSKVLNHLDIEMDTSTFEVTVAGRPVSLTAKEFELMKLFVSNPRKVFTKSQLFRSVWGEDYLKDENTVMVHIRRLREKIEEDPSNPRYILTVWGIGYKLSEE